MGRPRKDEGRDTRREILDRALELFANQGFSGSSMRQIARAVGVRESALYHHFPNKDAIFSALLAEAGPGAIAAVLSSDLGAFVTTMGGREFLRMLGDTLATLWVTPRERYFVRLVMAEWPRLREAGLFDGQKVIGQVRARVGELLEKLSRAGVIRRVDPKAAALRLMGPFMLLRVQHLADLSREPDVAAFRADLALHLDSFWDTVKPEPGRRAS